MIEFLVQGNERAAVTPQGSTQQFAEVAQDVSGSADIGTHHVRNDRERIEQQVRIDLRAKGHGFGREQIGPELRSLHRPAPRDV